MKFKVGDIANGVETSEEIIEADSYVDALEMLIERANLYCHSIDEEDEFKRKLTKEQRQKLEDWYAKHIFESIEWHDDSVLFSICKEGLTSTTEINDKDLIEQYKEYADEENILKKDRII